MKCDTDGEEDVKLSDDVVEEGPRLGCTSPQHNNKMHNQDIVIHVIQTWTMGCAMLNQHFFFGSCCRLSVVDSYG